MSSDEKKGYLEFGRVLNESGDRFLSGTRETWDEAKKFLSGDEVRILRIKHRQLPWLAKEVLSCLSEQEFDQVMAELEAEAAPKEPTP